MKRYYLVVMISLVVCGIVLWVVNTQMTMISFGASLTNPTLNQDQRSTDENQAYPPPIESTLPSPDEIKSSLEKYNISFDLISPEESSQLSGVLTYDQAIAVAEKSNAGFMMETASEVRAYLAFLTDENLRQTSLDGKETVDENFTSPKLIWLVALSGIKHKVT